LLKSDRYLHGDMRAPKTADRFSDGKIRCRSLSAGSASLTPEDGLLTSE
jgi:hypothetical protein